MADPSPMDMTTHERTYGAFLRLLQFATVASLLVVALVVYLIAA
ncbi:aa3-type cytochrome c oxidase subunit IV [Sphingomonas abietis]|uniref:Aa3-type cytochrome c oxidase subunit IV n=1 Tax=Sphingomonas abietis TaxID=3012344 RepID=A0ABY7NJI4_9SPHN|nr:aa3-type cytochrome c oxidase subunit IV [Sphingomonas abietis]WBO21140.1 aa3-type cytochrome c oxidase subunit IV [Sphingomonas abietis]